MLLLPVLGKGLFGGKTALLQEAVLAKQRVTMVTAKGKGGGCVWCAAEAVRWTLAERFVGGQEGIVGQGRGSNASRVLWRSAG